jgi:two-component system response regulator LytT
VVEKNRLIKQTNTMQIQAKPNGIHSEGYPLSLVNHPAYPVPETEEADHFLRKHQLHNLDDLLKKLMLPADKKSFLVYRNNKYISVPTENIALFRLQFGASVIQCYDKQEYTTNHSLEQIQTFLPGHLFFRLNRQYLISFRAIKEVEHYFARKLLVNLAVPVKEKILVSKEKVTSFLHWLDNR